MQARDRAGQGRNWCGESTAGKIVHDRYVNDSLGISYPLPDEEWYVSEDLANSSDKPPTLQTDFYLIAGE